MNYDFFNHINNNIVRDLYWLLFSPSPLGEKTILDPFQQFPKELQDEWESEAQHYFKELDNNPKELIHFLDNKKSHRLGFHAEALLSYFFQTFRPIKLLLQNYQIVEDKTTVGEIDFIIEYKGKTIHLECAIKYYLLRNPDQVNNLKEWVGPRQKDNLHLKLDKVIKHQLPLGRHKYVSEKIGREVDTSYLFIKGKFFTDVQTNSSVAKDVNSYLKLSKVKTSPFKPVYELQKPNWLSSLAYNKERDTAIYLASLDNPKLYLFDDGEVRFIVPDDWK